MVPMSRYALMGGTVAAAVGIGYFMQLSPTAQARYGSGVEVASLAPVLSDGALASDTNLDVMVTVPDMDPAPVAAPVPLAALQLDGATPTPAPQRDPEPAKAPEADIEMAAVESVADAPALPLAEPAPDCAAEMTAEARAAAMVHLTLTSCQPGARVTIHHNGMMVQGVTGPDGGLEMTLPALAEAALFIAEFPNRDGAVAEAQVTSLVDYDRVVLQWRGDAGFLLGAYEFDAAFGSEGHRHSDNPGSLEATVQGQGGVLTRHGDAAIDNGLRAAAYTFPRGMAQRNGTVALSVEAEVTAANCGQEIAAQSLQISSGAAIEVRELILAMPDCAAVGEYIVLINMAENLTIAAN